jgi:hypothetical protein
MAVLNVCPMDGQSREPTVNPGRPDAQAHLPRAVTAESATIFLGTDLQPLARFCRR